MGSYKKGEKKKEEGGWGRWYGKPAKEVPGYFLGRLIEQGCGCCPPLKRGVQSHTKGKERRRWHGRIDSRGKNLERDRSQFLLPPHQSVIPVDAKREVGVETELPVSLTSFPIGAVQHVPWVEQNSRMKILTSSRQQWGGEEKSAPHVQARLEVWMSRKWLYIRARRVCMVWPM